MNFTNDTRDEIDRILRDLDQGIKEVDEGPVPPKGTAYDLVKLYEPAIEDIKVAINYQTSTLND